MIADRQPHGTRCIFCQHIIPASEVKVCAPVGVACVPCAAHEWGQVYRYGFVSHRRDAT